MVPSGMPPLGETRFRDGQLVLRLSGDSLSPELLQFLQQLGITVVATVPVPIVGGALVTLELPSGLSVREAIARLESNQIVPQIAPVYVHSLAQSGGTGKGDPAQYILDKFKLEKTHQTATGKGITVAVIDSEVDKRHTELQGAISNELDTLSVKEPPHFHGTAMAGAIVSRDRLMGVAPGARIIAVRAFGEASHNSEGTTISIIMGVAWAVGQGAKVINMSFAGPRDPMLERAVKTAREQGVILVAAAGNAGPRSPPLYPGADPNVIAVTATDVRDRGFRGANQGPQLSVAAPGVEILAPAPEENYQMSTGTSIATAHVSGVVALMLERNPKLTPYDVRKILEETATDLGPRGKDAQFGWGLVNPEKALQAVDARYKSSDASRARR
jgi:subtilisin family serine protease